MTWVMLAVWTGLFAAFGAALAALARPRPEETGTLAAALDALLPDPVRAMRLSRLPSLCRGAGSGQRAAQPLRSGWQPDA